MPPPAAVPPPFPPAAFTPDVAWRDGLRAAFAEAAALRRPLALKALGQGMGPADDW